MRISSFLVFALAMFSCTQESIVGFWRGSTSPTGQGENCSTVEFKIIKTENKKYHGNGTVATVDCNTGRIKYTTDFSMSNISFDKPLVHFEASIDGSIVDTYRFTGTLTENFLDGKLSTWTTRSDSYDSVFKIRFKRY